MRETIRLIVVGTLALVALAYSLAALGVLLAPRASLGFALSGLTVEAVAPSGPAGRAGLTRGNQLAPSTPVDVRLRALWYDAYRPGQTERLEVGAPGRYRTVELRAQPHPPPFGRTAELLIVLRMLTYVVFVCVGAGLVLLRPARFTWAFFACCIGLATFPAFIGWSLTLLNPMAGAVSYAIWLVAADLANVGFLAFALRFPNDDIAGRRLLLWRTLPLWLAVFLTVDAWSTFGWYTGAALPRWLPWVPNAGGFLAWLLGTAALAATYRRAEPRNRRRLQWAIAGSSIGYFAWYLDKLLGDLGFGIAGRIVGFATLALPLSIAYAVLKHRVVDIRFVVNRALTYSLLGSLLVAFFAFSSWATALLLQQSHTQLPVQIGLALLIGALLHRFHRRLETGLEALLFRGFRGAAAELNRALPAMNATTSYDSLERLLCEVPFAAFELDFVRLYRLGENGDYTLSAQTDPVGAAPVRFAPSDPLLSTLATQPHEAFVRGSELVVPVVDGAFMPALVVCGPHRNGFALDPDERALLYRFAAGAVAPYRSLRVRAASLRRLSALLRRPGALSDVEFVEDLGEHILGELSPDDTCLLAACAILPAASAEEVAFLVERPATRDRLDELAATTGLVVKRGDRYGAHPLLQALLVRRAGRGTRSDLMRCAAESMRRGDRTRAAELYAAAGERAALAAHPELLLARAAACVPLENDAALRALLVGALEREAGAEPAVHAALAAWLAYALAESGDLREAGTLLERFPDAPAACARALLAGKSGQVEACDALLRRCESGPRGEAAALPAPLLQAIFIARVRGRWSDAAALLESALLGAQNGTALLVLAERIFHYWVTGDERRCVEAADDLLRRSAAGESRILDFLAHEALGREAPPGPTAYPRFAAYAWLMRACRTADTAAAAEAAQCARECALDAGESFVATLASVALAEIEPAARDAALARAAAAAHGIESEPLAAALALLIGNFEGAGMLDSLVRHARAARAPSRALRLEVATGRVLRGGEAIAVSERELALLIALARSPRPTGSVSLADAIWPGLDDVGGARALQTCVYRVRQRLNDVGAIESVAQGYRLGAELGVDLWEGEGFAAALKARTPADPFTRLRLEGLARHFAAARPAPALAWEWFDSLERRIATLRRELRHLLGRQYVQNAENRRALAVAREMIAEDELDEGARELAIRALVAAGDVAEARRELRLYREALRDSGPEPAASLDALFPVEADRHGSVSGR